MPEHCIRAISESYYYIVVNDVNSKEKLCTEPSSFTSLFLIQFLLQMRSPRPQNCVEVSVSLNHPKFAADSTNWDLLALHMNKVGAVERAIWDMWELKPSAVGARAIFARRSETMLKTKQHLPTFGLITCRS